MFKRDKKSFNLLVYFTACLIVILGFTFGYLYTLGKVKDNPAEIGSYEAVKTEQNEMQSAGIQNVLNQKIVSDDAIFVRVTRYSVCGHTIKESGTVTKDISSLTEMQFRTAYSDWNVERFSTDEIMISKEFNEKCPNHYVVKEREGKVSVYYQKPVNGATLKEMTNIPILNLSNEDQKRLKAGIEVNSNQSLAELLEDFGS